MVFHQPSGCLLEDAEVHLKFTSSSSVQLSEWFGPIHLKRELAHHTGSKTRQMQPQVNVGVGPASVGVGGVGTTTTTDTDETRRWELWARTVASPSTGLYDTLVWQWQGNPFKTDIMPRLPFKSGMVLYHNDTPFVVSLEIKGKLQGPTGSWVKSKATRFPREIVPVVSTEDLGTIAEKLHEQMLVANEENRA